MRRALNILARPLLLAGLLAVVSGCAAHYTARMATPLPW